jgi:hypothetical protein
MTHAEIVIVGAGIAGLWTFHRLKKRGYDVVLLHDGTVGGTQTLAAQGIIHAGLKYALGGKVSRVARTIAQMPKRWRAALETGEEVDLRQARVLAQSQQLLMPRGFVGGVVEVMTRKVLDDVTPCPPEDWPDGLHAAGFTGTAVNMNELVLDVPSIVQALAAPYADSIFPYTPEHAQGTRLTIHTAAAGNAQIAADKGADKGLKTQHRPLLMGLLAPAPFPLYAHLVGTGEKPIATITTHTKRDGSYVWYIGGSVAESTKDAPRKKLYKAIEKALLKALPDLDLSGVRWGAYPVDRVEGRSGSGIHMPETPTVHVVGDDLYCWPTKMTFAPLLSDDLLEHIERRGLMPREPMPEAGHAKPLPYTNPPWEEAQSWA